MSAQGADVEQQLDVRALLGMMRRRGWIVAVITVVATVTALLLSLQQSEQYAATAQVRITDPSSEAVFAITQGINSTQAAREVATQLEILRSPRIEDAAEELLGDSADLVTGVSFSAVGDTDVLRIRATSEVPSVAQDAANAYADVYVSDRSRQVVGSLEARAEELRQAAAGVDEELGVISVELRQLYAGEVVEPTDTDANAAQIRELEEQRASLRTEQADLRRQATTLEGQAAGNPEQAASLLAQARSFRSQANAKEGEIAELTAQITTLAETTAEAETPPDVRIAELEDERLRAQELKADFRSRASEFELEAAVRQGGVEVIAAADRPRAPFAPTPEKDAMLAGILGLLLGVGLVFLLERLDDRLGASDEVEAIAGAPVLGTVLVDSAKKRFRSGTLPKGPRHLVAGDSLDAEAYRTFATSLRFSVMGKDKHVIAITSASGSEGKSTVTANLAVSLADAGLSVALVSADLRRPAIGEIFEIAETKVDGLSSALLGDASVAEILVPVALPSGRSISFIPSGPVPTNPAELLGSRRMAQLLAEVAAKADYVLLDCPPILPVSDVLSLSQFVDGVVLLAVPGRSRTHQLAEACVRIRKVGADVLGVVLNGVPRTPGRYGYYHYYRRYDQAQLPIPDPAIPRPQP